MKSSVSYLEVNKTLTTHSLYKSKLILALKLFIEDNVELKISSLRTLNRQSIYRPLNKLMPSSVFSRLEDHGLVRNSIFGLKY